jgi:hypothetical protein
MSKRSNTRTDKWDNFGKHDIGVAIVAHAV